MARMVTADSIRSWEQLREKIHSHINWWVKRYSPKIRPDQRIFSFSRGLVEQDVFCGTCDMAKNILAYGSRTGCELLAETLLLAPRHSSSWLMPANTTSPPHHWAEDGDEADTQDERERLIQEYQAYFSDHKLATLGLESYD